MFFYRIPTYFFYLSSLQCVLSRDILRAIRLCSLNQRVCIAVRAGCSLQRESPAAKQWRFLVEILHSSSAILESNAGINGFRMCKSVYFNFPRIMNRTGD